MDSQRAPLLLAAALLACGSGVLRPPPSGLPVNPPVALVIFPADNPWNRDVSADLIHPRSDAYLASMDSTSGSIPTSAPSPGMASRYVVVGGAQPRVPGGVPVRERERPRPLSDPAHAPVEGGTSSTGDRHVLVLDADRHELYELFAAYPMPGGAWRAARARAGASTRTISGRRAGPPPTRPGYPSSPASSARTRCSTARRSVTRCASPRPARSGLRLPGHRRGLQLDRPGPPPMGLRVRLRAGFDLSGLRARVPGHPARACSGTG